TTLDRLVESRDGLVEKAALVVAEDGSVSAPAPLAPDPFELPEAPAGRDELLEAADSARELVAELEVESAAITDTVLATAEATDATAAAILEVLAAAHSWSVATPAPPHTPADAA